MWWRTRSKAQAYGLELCDFSNKKNSFKPQKNSLPIIPFVNVLANPEQSLGLWAILQIYKFKKKYFTNYNPKNAHSFVNVLANPEQSPGLWASLTLFHYFEVIFKPMIKNSTSPCALGQCSSPFGTVNISPLYNSIFLFRS